jgi:hypothetical protein
MNFPDPPFALSEGERAHPLWKRLEAHFRKRLSDKRGKNDGPLSYEETLTLRGHIECLKGILQLGEEPPQDGN